MESESLHDADLGDSVMDAQPPSRCFARSPQLSFRESVSALMSLTEVPPGRPDLDGHIPDEGDAELVVSCVERELIAVKKRPSVRDLIDRCSLRDEDLRALVCYKIEHPFPVYRWLNGWLQSSRRDVEVQKKVGPFFTLLYRAMEKLPKIRTQSSRAVTINSIPALENTYKNYKTRFAPGKELSFWSLASFSTSDDVMSHAAFLGAPLQPAIVYTCASLEGVDMEPFTPRGLPSECEILPLCPMVFTVSVATKVGPKLVVTVEQNIASHRDAAYLKPLFVSPTPLKGDADGAIVATPSSSLSVISTTPPRPRHATCLKTCGREGCSVAVGFTEPFCFECEWQMRISTPLANLLKAADDEIASELIVLPRRLQPDYISVLENRKPYHIACWDGTLPHNICSRLHTLMILRESQISDASLLSEANHSYLSQLFSLSVHADELSPSEIACICRYQNLCSLSMCSISVTDTVVKQIASMKQLLALTMDYCRLITDEGIAHLRGLVHLQTLNLSQCCQITDSGLANLSGLVHLQKLYLLRWDQITDVGVAHLSDLIHLQTLKVSWCDMITDAGIAHLLRGLVHVRTLNLRGCKKITDSGLANLSGLVQLHTLNLSECKEITDAVVAHLSDLMRLQTLNLSCCIQITDAGIAHLSGLVELHTLNLSCCSQITDAGIAHLSGLVELHTLNLSCCSQITDAGIAHLSDLMRLQTLNLSWCEITDAGIAHLSGLVELHTLNLSECSEITDAGIAHLSGLVELHTLELNCRQITDAGIAHLRFLMQLRALKLFYCGLITDAGIAHLRGLVHMQTLHFIHCDKLTDAGIAHLSGLVQLQALMVGCRQFTDDGVVHLRCLMQLRVLTLLSCEMITDAGIALLSGMVQLQRLKLVKCRQLTEAGIVRLKTMLECEITSPMWA